MPPTLHDVLKKWLKRLGIALLVLLLLVICAWQFENWRGARAWEAAQSRAELADLSLDVEDYQPASIPDEENLLKHPEFLQEWNGEIEPKLAMLSAMGFPDASVFRAGEWDPSAGQPIDYRSYFREEMSEEEAEAKVHDLTSELRKRLMKLTDLVLSYPNHDLSNLSVPTPDDPSPQSRMIQAQGMVNSMADLALLAVRRGETETAIRHLEARNRLINAFARGASANHFNSMGLQSRDLGVIWEGIRTHSWTSPQLESLSKLLQDRDYFEALEETVRFEAVYMVHAVDAHEERVAESKAIIRKMKEEFDGDFNASAITPSLPFLYHAGPSGWNLQRKALAVDAILDFLDYRQQMASEDPDEWKFEDMKSSHRYTPYDSGASMFNILFLLELMCKEQTTRTRVAQIAIAAEQFYLKKGSYPESLEELSCNFDITDASDPKKRALAYELDQKGLPQIWSKADPTIRWQFSGTE